MKRTLKTIATLVFVASALSLVSCGGNSNNSYQEPASSNSQAESNYQEEVTQSNPIDRFVGRYDFGEGVGVEVLSDGRVLQIDHIIASGEEVKKYIADITIISDHAFAIYGDVFFPGDTPIYVMRNGSEQGGTWVKKFGNDYFGVVFDVSERRIYLGREQAYKNRDVSEAEYIKYH